MDVMDEAADGDSALKVASKIAPDVVLTDVKMLGMGISKRLSVWSACFRIRVIALVMFDDVPFPVRLSEATSIRYLTKGWCPAKEMIEAVHTFSLGGFRICPRALSASTCWRLGKALRRPRSRSCLPARCRSLC